MTSTCVTDEDESIWNYKSTVKLTKPCVKENFTKSEDVQEDTDIKSSPGDENKSIEADVVFIKTDYIKPKSRQPCLQTKKSGKLTNRQLKISSKPQRKREINLNLKPTLGKSKSVNEVKPKGVERLLKSGSISNSTSINTYFHSSNKRLKESNDYKPKKRKISIDCIEENKLDNISKTITDKDCSYSCQNKEKSSDYYENIVDISDEDLTDLEEEKFSTIIDITKHNMDLNVEEITKEIVDEINNDTQVCDSETIPKVVNVKICDESESDAEDEQALSNSPLSLTKHEYSDTADKNQVKEELNYELIQNPNPEGFFIEDDNCLHSEKLPDSTDVGRNDSNANSVIEKTSSSLSIPKKQTSLFSYFKARPGNQNVNPVFTQTKSSLTKSHSDVPLKTTESRVIKTSAGRLNVKKKECPFYKRIPNTKITVDAFRYGVIPNCEAYILTHFHYDHYGGLTKKFSQPIYCSKVTANLVERRLGVHEKWLNPLPMWTPTKVCGVTLTLMEANHCPGAVIILFEASDGRKILHTGDFRATEDMEQYRQLQGVRISELYLDTTYCDPTYSFPAQDEVIQFSVSLVTKYLRQHPKTLIVCGTYTIGKERVFIAIAKAIKSQICVMRDKKKVLDCLDDPELNSRLTLDWNLGQVHVLPMAKLNQKFLSEHLDKHKRFDSILALEPTGWTHSRRTISLDNLQPKWSSHAITLYGVPYSEHSSYSELKRFVQFLRPDKILPTVNNGDPASRQKMEQIFTSWLDEGTSEVKVEQKQNKLNSWIISNS